MNFSRVILYFFELGSVFFILKSLKLLLVIKKGICRKLLLFISCFFLVAVIIFIGDFVNLPPVILGFLICVCISFEGSLIQKLTIGLIFACTSFSFNAIHDNFVWQHDSFIWQHQNTAFIRTLFWGIFYLYLKHNAPGKDYELSPSLWKLLFVLTLTPLGIVLCIVLLTEPLTFTNNITSDSAVKGLEIDILYYYKQYSGNTLANLVLLIIALFSFIGILRTITILAKYQKLLQENALISLNQKYYDAMEQQHFEIRRIKHDLINHLQTLYTLPSKKQKEYLKELIENKAFTATLNYSGDSTVNAVLSVKESQIRQNNIDFDLHVSIENELAIGKADICALFADTLDNAIEACLELPIEKRTIFLDTKAKKGLFVLNVKNPTMNNYDNMKFIPETTKKDKRNHGYGLKSINEIVKRYKGSLEINVENGIFSIFLYFPC